MKKNETKSIAIGCQGGGAHGAFTWGVLDYLLEDGRFDIQGASGTSAGGMNCLALSQGMAEGGNEGARKMLHKYWKTLGEKSKKAGLVPTHHDKFKGGHGVSANPVLKMLSHVKAKFSPYQWNPKNKNMLNDLVREFFDFNTISKNEALKVFLCATNVRSSKLKIFSGKELTPEAALASACLPSLFHAVEIDGEAYWDGGFIGNPAIFPLIYECETQDILVILLTPQHRKECPKTVQEIHWRQTELSLINTLMREMRSIHFISELIDKGIADGTKIKKVRMHIIENPETFRDLHHSSALNSDWDFFNHLFKEGRDTAAKWMKKNFKDIGVKSTINFADFD